MHKLQREYFVDGRGVVLVSFEMTMHQGFKPVTAQVGPGKAPGIQQHLPNVVGKGIAVPDPKMVELVPPEEQPFEVKRGDEMVGAGHPLRHAIVVCVLCFGRELEQVPGDSRRQRAAVSTQAAIGSDPQESRVSVGNQPQRDVIVRECRLRRAKNRPDEVVVKIRGPESELGLLQREQAVMMPGGLPKHSKGKWVALKQPGVSVASRLNLWQ